MHRLTERPERADFEGEERRAWDLLAGAWSTARAYASAGDGVEAPRPEPLMALSPLVGWASTARSLAAFQQQGKPGSFTALDHELATLTLAFDTGYLDLLPLHVPLALAAGVPGRAIAAIRDHDDAALTAEELVVVGFVRAVVDGAVTDESFAAIRARLGRERGVYDLVALVLNVLARVRTGQVFGGGRAVPRARVDELVAAAVAGTLPPGDLAAYESLAFGPGRAVRVAP